MKDYCNFTYYRSHIDTSTNLWKTTFKTLLRLDIIELLVVTPDLKGLEPNPVDSRINEARKDGTMRLRHAHRHSKNAIPAYDPSAMVNL